MDVKAYSQQPSMPMTVTYNITLRQSAFIHFPEIDIRQVSGIIDTLPGNRTRRAAFTFTAYLEYSYFMPAFL
jgi:hypothetical protein